MEIGKKVTRRSFLELSTLGTAGLSFAGMLGAPSLRAGGNPSDTIGLGIIGVGVRGSQLLREAMRVPGTQMRAICDIYTGHMERAVKAVNNPDLKTYTNYNELLNNPDIDAVIIATPDHWHSKMTCDAADAGKDVYLEKCMTRTIPEAKDIVTAIKRNKRIFQLGHGGRSSSVSLRAREIYNSGILGKVTQVRIATFRNSVEPQWRWYSSYNNFTIPSDADPEHIEWDKFLGSAPKRAFDLRRFFHWRCYWDYGTGIAGDLLSHQYDAVNDIMGVGIPKTCVCSGGIYYWDDDREVPDVWNVVYDYPERGLSITYSCEFNNGHYGTELQLLGKNATLEKGWGGIQVFLEPYTDRNREIIEKLREEKRAKGEEVGRREALPVYSYSRGDGMYVTGHMQNFIDCVRLREKARCNEDVSFEEAVTSIMSVIAFQQKRQVTWDPVTQEII